MSILPSVLVLIGAVFSTAEEVTLRCRSTAVVFSPSPECRVPCSTNNCVKVKCSDISDQWLCSPAVRRRPRRHVLSLFGSKRKQNKRVTRSWLRNFLGARGRKKSSNSDKPDSLRDEAPRKKTYGKSAVLPGAGLVASGSKSLFSPSLIKKLQRAANTGKYIGIVLAMVLVPMSCCAISFAFFVVKSLMRRAQRRHRDSETMCLESGSARSSARESAGSSARESAGSSSKDSGSSTMQSTYVPDSRKY